MFEHVLAFVWWNPRPIVSHNEAGCLVQPSDGNRYILLSVFDCISETNFCFVGSLHCG